MLLPPQHEFFCLLSRLHPGLRRDIGSIAPQQPVIDVGPGPFEARLDVRVFSARQAHASPEPGPYVAQIQELADLNNKSNSVIAILQGPPGRGDRGLENEQDIVWAGRPLFQRRDAANLGHVRIR